MFHITAWKLVSNHDREIEIISFGWGVKKYLKHKYGNPPCAFLDMSCEMIAQELLDYFVLSKCQVLEDGENGAIVTA
jgi:hypothetical protein